MTSLRRPDDLQPYRIFLHSRHSGFGLDSGCFGLLCSDMDMSRDQVGFGSWNAIIDSRVTRFTLCLAFLDLGSSYCLHSLRRVFAGILYTTYHVPRTMSSSICICVNICVDLLCLYPVTILFRVDVSRIMVLDFESSVKLINPLTAEKPITL